MDKRIIFFFTMLIFGIGFSYSQYSPSSFINAYDVPLFRDSSENSEMLGLLAFGTRVKELESYRSGYSASWSHIRLDPEGIRGHKDTLIEGWVRGRYIGTNDGFSFFNYIDNGWGKKPIPESWKLISDYHWDDIELDEWNDRFFPGLFMWTSRFLGEGAHEGTYIYEIIDVQESVNGMKQMELQLLCIENSNDDSKYKSPFPAEKFVVDVKVYPNLDSLEFVNFPYKRLQEKYRAQDRILYNENASAVYKVISDSCVGRMPHNDNPALFPTGEPLYRKDTLFENGSLLFSRKAPVYLDQYHSRTDFTGQKGNLFFLNPLQKPIGDQCAWIHKDNISEDVSPEDMIRVADSLFPKAHRDIGKLCGKKFTADFPDGKRTLEFGRGYFLIHEPDSCVRIRIFLPENESTQDYPDSTYEYDWDVFDPGCVYYDDDQYQEEEEEEEYSAPCGYGDTLIQYQVNVIQYEILWDAHRGFFPFVDRGRYYESIEYCPSRNVLSSVVYDYSRAKWKRLDWMEVK